MIILGVKLIELVYMTDPDVQIFTRQIFQDEVKEAGIINLSEHQMRIGFVYIDLPTDDKTLE